MNDIEQTLSDTLTRRGDVVGSADLDGVYGRARQIRRRRVGAGVVGALAVAAVILPLSLGGGTSPITPPVATQSSAPTTRDLASLPVGDAPTIAYVSGSTFVDTDGSTRDFPAKNALAFTSYHGGWMVLSNGTNTAQWRLRLFDGQGAELWSRRTNGRPVVTPDIYSPYWATVTHEGTTLHFGIASGMGDGERTQKVDGSATINGLLPDGRLVYTQDGVWVTDMVSKPTKVDVIAHAFTASPATGLVSGFDDSSMQAVVVDLQDGSTKWTSDAMSLGSFSQDGSLIVGYDGDTGLPRILDANSGKPLCNAADLESINMSGAGPLTWESGNTLLGAFTSEEGQNALVRIAVPSGSTPGDDVTCDIERAETPDGISAAPYALSLQP
ncbi:MAG: hypothetical protein V9G04_03110 [Nocardioides sp.]|jgi:hypothetical protein